MLFGLGLDSFMRREALVVSTQLIVTTHKLQPSLVALLECVYVILLQLIYKLFTSDNLLT